MSANLNDFTDPLGQLSAFHLRSHELCDKLEVLAEQAEGGAEASELRAAAGEIYHHFSVQNVLHHKDEEEGLFPLLARQSLKLADQVHRARSQHQALADAMDALNNFLMNPRAMGESPADFATQARAYAALQRDHLRYEDEELLEMARHIVSSTQLKELGKAMAARRGR